MIPIRQHVTPLSRILCRIPGLLKIFLNHALAIIPFGTFDDKKPKFHPFDFIIRNKGRMQKCISQKFYGNEFFRILLFPLFGKGRQNGGKYPSRPQSFRNPLSEGH
jgi:hypothetical protein